MTNRSELDTSSYGAGQGGNLRIVVDNLELRRGANILSSAFGDGNGGNIEIVADHMLMSGVHPEVYTNIVGKQALAPTAIGSQTGVNSGNGGDIILHIGQLELLDGARISVETFGPGAAGNIEVMADAVLISGINNDMLQFYGQNTEVARAGILSGTASGFLGNGATGNGGDIHITADKIQLKNGGLLSSNTGSPGKGGNIQVAGKTIMLDSGALITSSSKVNNSSITGNAGDISLRADKLFSSSDSSITTAAEEAASGKITISSRNIKLNDNTFITAESSGLGNAGDIHFNTESKFTMQNSTVSTKAQQADGGNIKVDTDYLIHLVNSEITSSVDGGADTAGGNISIDPEYVVLDHSRIIANAYEGAGGNINIVADVFLADPESIVDASSALGIDGNVEIESPITSVSGTIAPLPEEFRSVVALLRKPCMARIKQGKYSSFVVNGRDGLPREPGSTLPSPLLLQ